MSQHASLASPTATLELVTMQLGDQPFGIAVEHVHDVLESQTITRVPLAPGAVIGSLNLRGRIVTVLDLRTALGLDRAANPEQSMIVVIAQDRELYALLVDHVGDVLPVQRAALEPLPQTLAAGWRAMSGGIVKLDNQLLLMLLPERLLATVVSSEQAGAHA